MTSEEIKFLASHILDGQRDVANQIIAALRGSRRDFAGDDPDNKEVRPSNPRRRRAPKDKGVKFRSPFENELSVRCRCHKLPPLINYQRKIRNYLADELTHPDDWLKNTVTTQDINDFNPEIGECCTANNFRLHLAGTPGDVWNRSATRIFVNSFLEAHQEYEAQNEIIREVVMNKCSAVVKSTIRQYRLKRKNTTREAREQERRRKNRAERKRAVSIYHTLTFYGSFYIFVGVPPSARPHVRLPCA